MYTVGQEVVLKTNLKAGFLGDIYVNSDMVAMAGSTQVINHVCDAYIGLENIVYCWPRQAFQNGEEEDLTLRVDSYVRVNLTEEVIENFSRGFVSTMHSQQGKVFKVTSIGMVNGEIEWVKIGGNEYFWDYKAFEVLKQSEVDEIYETFGKTYGTGSLFRATLNDELKKICTINKKSNGEVEIKTCRDGVVQKCFTNILAFNRGVDAFKLVCVEKN